MITQSISERAGICRDSPRSAASSVVNESQPGTTNTDTEGVTANEEQGIESSLTKEEIVVKIPAGVKENRGYSKNQWIAFMTLAFGNVCDGAIFSIQAPFYPPMTEGNGVSPTEYGFVLGVFQLVVFIVSPICGALLRKSVSPRLMYCGGIVGVSLCTISFGLLQFVHGHLMFVSLSFALRILQGCGQAACLTATFTIIATEFSESVATTFATLETCDGLGDVVGPLLGGALYQAGGFFLPFVTIGGTYLLFGAASLVTLYGLKGKPSVDNASKGFVSLLRIPEVSLAGLSIFLAGNEIGFLMATLEPHLRNNFQLSPLMTGVVFAIDGVAYALAGPIWGRIADGAGRPAWTLLAGCFLTFIGILLIGPAPLIPIKTILWVVCVGVAVQGIGVGASTVGGVVLSLRSAIEHGFPDDVSTYGLLSGLWSSSFALGLFIGPSLGGILLDTYGFAHATYSILASQLVLAVLLATPASVHFIRQYGIKTNIV